MYNLTAMKNESLTDTRIWEEFEKAARRHRRNPMEMLTDFMQERLETWELEKLFKELKRDARKSGYSEEDAVEIVRQYRLEKKQQLEKKQRVAS